MITTYNKSKKMYNVQLTQADISEKAYNVYSNTDPLEIWTDAENSKFIIEGCFSFTVDSIEELEKAFEELAEEDSEI